MASQMWLFCLHCYDDKIFVYEYRSHGMFGGGHQDWHCSRCQGCRYEPARKR